MEIAWSILLFLHVTIGVLELFYYSVSIIVYILKTFLSLGFNNHFSPVFNLLYFLTHRPIIILFYNLLILPVYILDFYHFLIELFLLSYFLVIRRNMNGFHACLFPIDLS